MNNIKTLIFDLGNVIIPLEDEKNWWNETFLGIFENYQEVQQLKEDQFFVRYAKSTFAVFLGLRSENKYDTTSERLFERIEE